MRGLGGFGALALSAMLTEEGLSQSDQAVQRHQLTERKTHFKAKAKRVIFIFLNGGLSHVESFDYKPKLFKNAGKKVKFYQWQGRDGDYTFYLKRPQWEFKRGGQSGLMVGDLFPHLRKSADDLCLINSMVTDHTNHYEAALGMHTGSFTFSRPSFGSWVSYGLGSENKNLPSFVVVSPTLPYAGAQTFGSDFLPGIHQGVHILPGMRPIENLSRRSPSRRLQELELELLSKANKKHLGGTPEDKLLEARIRSFETAFGMQTQAPEIFDLSQENQKLLDLYGLNKNSNSGFGWQCLIARRLAEQGVRFIELVSSNWDQHGDMNGHIPLAKQIDQPIAGLIQDLKQRGMLEDTLVVLTTEFGRTPHHLDKMAKGREHHHQVFSTALAGGGVRGGHIHGSSDDFGIEPATDRVHLHDFHATLLHLMGLDHERLTYTHAGRDYRLTDVYGEVVKEIIA